MIDVRGVPHVATDTAIRHMGHAESQDDAK